MRLKKLEVHGFKSFAKKCEFIFDSQITAIVGPNGSGKSNVVEALRFALGEQSMKSMRGKSGTDLIWNGSKEIPKMSRARVSATFDNRDRIFHFYNDENKRVQVDFDEIVIAREVFADGTSSYTLNGTDMRLRDIQEIVASVNIGASGHHIVSQGEADRYLNASPRERKEMIEEALGLRHYHYRIAESERKLEKSRANLREADILRREIAPHLRFLKKQVKKFEEAKEIRDALLDRYVRYLAVEKKSIEQSSTDTERTLAGLEENYTDIEHHIAEKKESLSKKEVHTRDDETASLEGEMKNLTLEKGQLSHTLGRLDGMIQMLSANTLDEKLEPESITLDAFCEAKKEIFTTIDGLLSEEIDFATLTTQLGRIKEALDRLTSRPTAHNEQRESVKLVELRAEYESCKNDLSTLEEREKTLAESLRAARDTHEGAYQEIRTLEKDIFSLERERDQLRHDIDRAKGILSNLALRTTRLAEEEREAGVLLGAHIVGERMRLLDTTDLSIDDIEKERKEIERMKIKLEDIGTGSGTEVMSEYNELSERDTFLEKEITDLSESITSLEEMISDLQKELEEKFIKGLDRVNTQFQEFFAYVFGGGKAKISTIKIPSRKQSTVTSGDADPALLEGDEKEEERVETGIDITVSVPRKTIRDINMLSGGERSLTSIAILFALSAVEPPPFLVLDETDATLDEVNSRKYGDMLKRLGELSQLILVTHNRETMASSDALYGVVFGRDDSSQIFSVKLEEAIKIAK